MDYIEAAENWNQNAEAWTALARAGCDVYRDHLNTPAFFQTLPTVTGLTGIDIGCGEGYNTRLLAKLGARMTAIDISPVFIEKAKEAEIAEPLNITYSIASATELPYNNETFDFAASFMCLMDIPDPKPGLSEAYRVLKPGGFLQFSISHPCFNTPHRRNLRDLSGRTYAIEIGRYFDYANGEISEWIFRNAPAELKQQYPKFKTPLFNFTISQWVNFIIEAGFVLEYMHEPRPDEETVQRFPKLQDAQQAPYFLHIRCRKPLKK